MIDSNKNFCTKCQEPHYSYFNYPNCGEKEQFAEKCPTSNIAKEFCKPPRAKLFCRSCGLKGHVFRNCPKGSVGKPKFLQNIVGSKMFLERKKKRFYRSYKIGKLLGQGGFGSVYAGLCTQFETPVAIKRVSKTRFSKSQNKFLFDDQLVPLEYKLLKKVQCVKGVIHVHDFYQLEDENIYVMEKPDQCKDLKDYVRDNHPLSEKSARKLFNQIVKIVYGCHLKGVFHRDIKSDNFLVDGNGTVYIIDFGCGLEVKEEGYSSDDFWGTDEYIPPEVFNRRTYHAEPTTVWSLGILLYEILKDNLPFGSNEFSIQHNEVPYQPKFTLELQDLIIKCLKKYPTDRISLEDILNHSWMTLDKRLNNQTKKRKYENCQDTQMQTDCEIDGSIQPEVKKQKIFKDQVKMKPGFIFPKPVPCLKF